MLLMVGKGIWGEITQAVKRYAKANNKYLKVLYNPDEDSIYLQYLAANNLYGWDGQWFKIYQRMDFYGRMQRILPLEK